MKRRKHKGRISPLAAEVVPVLRRLGQRQPRVNPEIWARWSSIVGWDLARRMIPRSFFRGTLVVAVGNSSWMHEVTYLKPKLLDKLGDAVGPGVVKDIKFTLDAALADGSSVKSSVPAPPQRRERSLPKEIAEATDAVKDDSLREIITRAVMANLKDH